MNRNFWKRLWSLLGGFGNLVFLFSSLPLVSKLRSWHEIVPLLESFWKDLSSIIRMMGRILDWMLLPYEYLTTLLFQLLPMDIPSLWHDPMVLGTLIFLYPLKYFRYRNAYDNNINYLQIYGYLNKITKSPIPMSHYKSLRSALKQITSDRTVERDTIVGIVPFDMPYLFLIREKSRPFFKALKYPQNKEGIEEQRLFFQDFLNNVLYPILRELYSVKEFNIMKLQKRKTNFALILFLLVFLDLLLKRPVESLGFLLTGLLTMVLFGLVPIFTLGILNKTNNYLTKKYVRTRGKNRNINYLKRGG